MTGNDPVLNRRITTIFINQIEEFKNMLLSIDEIKIPSIEFTIHKIRPSLIIFELDSLIKEYSTIMELLEKKENITELKTKCSQLASHIDDSIVELKTFLNKLS